MDTELRKRLEEAAKKYEPDAFDADYILPAREGFIVSGKRAAFRAGAEYGYKEAIEKVKEWWKQGSVWLDLMSIKDSNDLGDLINTFESDMNKLWEEKK